MITPVLFEKKFEQGIFRVYDGDPHQEELKFTKQTHSNIVVNFQQPDLSTTIADGTVIGQIKVILHDMYGGSSQMTPADPVGFVDVNFLTVGDTATLMWNGSHWFALASHAAAADTGVIDIAN